MIQKIWINLYWSPQIKHLQPHSASVSITSHQYHSLFATLLVSLHTSYSLVLSVILVDCHTSCFCWHTPTALTNSTSSCWKRPYCILDYWLINLSAYLLGHLSATAVSNCYHSPSDCIGHATSLLQTLLYLLWLMLFSLFVCLYWCIVSSLYFLVCCCWMCCSTGL